MTLPEYALQYNECTSDELRKFIYQRTGEPSLCNSSKRRSQLRKTLATLDQQADFPFEQLPAELRLRVYRELLVTPINSEERHQLKRHPQILATCNDIYDEAKGVLYEENTAGLNIYIAYFILGGTTEECFVLQGEGHNFSPCQGATLEDVFVEWKDHLRKVGHLKVSINLKPRGGMLKQDAPKFKPAHDILYSLCSFLSAENALKTVEINFTVRDEDVEEVRQAFMWPLTKLSGSCTLKVTGLPDDVEAQLMDQRSSSTVVKADCIGNARRALERLENIRKLALALNGAPDHYSSRDDFIEAIAESRLQLTPRLREEGYVDEALDREIQLVTENDVKNFLDGQIPVRVINEAQDEILVLRKLIQNAL